MQNTIDNKELLFVQYWKQPILRLPLDTVKYVVNYPNLSYAKFMYDGWLELRSLSDITYEEASYLTNLFFGDPDVTITHYHNHIELETRNKTIPLYFDGEMDTLHTGQYYLEAYDYLRSRSFAVPYLGLSVSQQLEYKWIKIKTEE